MLEELKEKNLDLVSLLEKKENEKVKLQAKIKELNAKVHSQQGEIQRLK